MNRFRTILAFVAMGTPSLAWAQADTAAMARTAAANQLGVLEYCQERGDVSSDAIDAQHSVITHLPQSDASTADAEGAGKKGEIALANGQTKSLSDMAGQTNTSVSDLCKRLGQSALRSAALYKNGGPAMPGGMQMPSMPNGMHMPGGMQMPSMPGMPSQALGGTPPS